MSNLIDFSKLLNKFQPIRRILKSGIRVVSPSIYWSRHLVEVPQFKSREESLQHFEWRNSQYPNYLELMPVDSADSLVVLDFGCGPGNDLVGFSEFSKCKELHGADVSATAIAAAEKRIQLHQSLVQFHKIDENSPKIDISDSTFDLIHSSGVLHHVSNLPATLHELHRVIKSEGKLRIMVYNKDSIWFHLKTAYQTQILAGKNSNMTTEEAFEKTTDGEDCPIAKCYTSDGFLSLMHEYGFEGVHLGNSFSLIEASLLPLLPEALMSKQLESESRKFLMSLTFDERNIPLYKGQVAGINSCYEFKKI